MWHFFGRVSIIIYILFSGSCSENQTCIDIANCKYTTLLNTLSHATSSEDLKNYYNETIKSTMCGGPSSNTVCCDITEGISSFLNWHSFNWPHLYTGQIELPRSLVFTQTFYLFLTKYLIGFINKLCIIWKSYYWIRNRLGVASLPVKALLILELIWSFSQFQNCFHLPYSFPAQRVL